jgi:hypothetical protein
MLSVSSVSVGGGVALESWGTIDVPVSWSTDATGYSSLQLNVYVIGGTATDGTDYSFLFYPIEVSPQGSTVATIDIIGDSEEEETESVSLRAKLTITYLDGN